MRIYKKRSMGGVGGDNDSEKGNKTKQKKMFILQDSFSLSLSVVCVYVSVCRYGNKLCARLLYNNNII